MNQKIEKYLDLLDQDFLTTHQAKEEAFWKTYMGIEDQEKQYLELETQLNEFKSDQDRYKNLKEFKTLKVKSNRLDAWFSFYEKNVIEGPSAQKTLAKINQLESELQNKKRNLETYYIDPETQTQVPASNNQLSMMIQTEKSEYKRQAAYKALIDSEEFILNNGFIEIIEQRNQFAHELGFSDFMDYKCQFSEGMSKEDTFKLIFEGVNSVKSNWEIKREELSKKHGKHILEAWNFTHSTVGDSISKLDPYFPFENSVRLWIENFENLGINYQKAKLTLDLLDRKGKYENGFMHAPMPCHYKNGNWVPGVINFTANANPKQIGSGYRALNTLFHEGGHAAHFSNVKQNSPIFSQEYPPTSMAMAETQSMFLDSFISDGEWQFIYAKNRQDESIPEELIYSSIKQKQEIAILGLLNLSVLSIFEKRLYELESSQLNPENIQKLARETEQEYYGFAYGRPLLSIPHLLSFDSAASYHGYLFASYAVAQTRTYFYDQYGLLCNQEKIGPELQKHYWEPGNSKSFTDMIESLTQKKLSAQDFVDDCCLSSQDKVQQTQERIQLAKKLVRSSGKSLDKNLIKNTLNAEIQIIHGKQQITTNGSNLEDNLEKLCDDFSTWIKSSKY